MDLDGCSSLCVVEHGFICTMTEPSVCHWICGDGLKSTSEECDDSNALNGDGCNSNCQIEANSYCTIDGLQCDVCGNSMRRPPEVCDDIDPNDVLGCTSDCKAVLSEWVCFGGTEATPDICTPKHGDGVIIGDEECDDGNLIGTDGCSNLGLINVGYNCSGNPSICDSFCGNGLLHAPQEECDDQNTINDDGCSNCF